MYNVSTQDTASRVPRASMSAIQSEPAPLRNAPHNLEAEQALLGAILINNESIERVSDFLEAQHFFDPLHQQIYETAAKLIASGKQANPITLKTFFANAEPIDAGQTVPQYLASLAANAATIINARNYGRIVHDLAIRRALILIGEDVVNAAYDSAIDFPPQEQIEEAETRLFVLAKAGANERAAASASEAMEQAIQRGNEAFRRGDCLGGIATGYPALDAKLGGLTPGDLIIIAGRPSMGKTAFGINIAANRVEEGKRIYFASLEMSTEQIGARLLSRGTGVPAADLRCGRDFDSQVKALLDEQRRWAGRLLIIDESSSLTSAQLMTRVRRAHRKHPLEAVVIDYLQLIRGTTYRGLNRVQEIAEISGSLKAMAKELGVPVIALSQLNRATETRDDKRPHLADLRDSGALEQDADIVMFVHRPAYYLEREQPSPLDVTATQDWERRLAAARGRAEIIIAKHRNGPTGIVELCCDEATMTFRSLDGRRS